MRELVVVLAGGLSKERKISLLTGKACFAALKAKGFNVKFLDVKDHSLEKLKKINPYKVFNALHGKYGEDGFVQSILEYLKIPYTHSGVLASSLAMDKELSRIIFQNNKIRVPKYFTLKKNDFKKIPKLLKKNKIKYPLVIKPIDEGSSLGVYICKNKKSFLLNYKKLKNYPKIIIEEYIKGREIQVGVLGNSALGAIELKPKREFYDYKAKYSKSAKTKHIMPAPLKPKKYKEVLRIAIKAHKLLGCRGVTRSDFRLSNKNKFYLLETNTQPGMTQLSLIPEMAAYKGIKFENLIKWILKDASINR